MIYVISGLPRSGTSMMMRMLAAGGLELLTDGSRTADESNPYGYYEFESVKSLKDGKTEWLEQARQKGVKIVSPLLPYLPSRYSYKIVFMRRDLNEVIASQAKMLNAHRKTSSPLIDGELIKAFRSHLVQVENWLSSQSNIQVFYISYNDLLRQPKVFIPRLVDFIDLPLNVVAMQNAIEPSLYRNRVNPEAAKIP